VKLNSRCFSVLVAVACLVWLPVASASFHLPVQPAKSQAKCPTVNVTCADSVNVGEKLSIVANVSGGDPNVTPTYNWTVSAGTIESGQGTSVIEVSTSELPDGGNITATVDVGGYDRSCSTSSSCTSSVMKKVEARKIDEYSAIRPKDENARLDNLAIELQNDPTTQAYIIAYGGRKSRAGAAQKAANRAKSYMVSKRGLDRARAVAVNGGLRETPTTELWIVPQGAEPPQATPSVAPSEVKSAKPKSTKKPAKSKSKGKKS
jgi:hypothetical protein